MAFGRMAGPTIVYRYGAKKPTSNAEALLDQLRKAHRYRNKLVEIELQRRKLVEEAVKNIESDVRNLADKLEQLELDIEYTTRKINSHKQKNRTRTVPAELKEQLKSLKAQRRETLRQMREAKKAAYTRPEILEAFNRIEEKVKAEHKKARNLCGLYWGTYCHVEQIISQIRKGPPPKFRRFDGSGVLAVQLQKGEGIARLESGEDRRIRIEGCGKRRILWLRIGSDENRYPIWATIPFTYHREIPSDAKIKWVKVKAKRIACQTEWEVLFTLERSSGWKKPDLAQDGVVAIDIGWRNFDDRIRVAYWIGSDGCEGEVALPHIMVGKALEQVEHLRSLRDKNFNEIKQQLLDAIETMQVPDWLTEAIKTLHQWRSQGRLAALAIRWRQQRFEGDNDIFTLLETWRVRDRHLYEWEAHLRVKAIRRRDDYFANVVANLSRRYKTAIVEDFDLRNVTQVDPTQTEQIGDGRQRYRARIAAAGGLRQMIKNRFAETQIVSAVLTTQTCTECGEVMNFDAAESVFGKCPHCGHTFDQDRAAAINLMRRYEEGLVAASGEVR
jgi:predicted RNA-binding Zn-ribbon protein involved in translation (DUF1610 family)